MTKGCSLLAAAARIFVFYYKILIWYGSDLALEQGKFQT